MMIGAASGFYPNYSDYRNPFSPQSRMSAGQIAPLSGGEQTTINPLTGEEEKSANPDEIKKAGRRSSPEECQTCKERKYQDGSDEGNVSFKNASHISPESAGAKVRAHEGEHVSNAYKKAAQNNGKVLNASVSIHTSICSECGRTYVSGGETNTTIKYTNEDNPYTKNKRALDAMQYVGANIDYAA